MAAGSSSRPWPFAGRAPAAPRWAGAAGLRCTCAGGTTAARCWTKWRLDGLGGELWGSWEREGWGEGFRGEGKVKVEDVLGGTGEVGRGVGKVKVELSRGQMQQ